MTESQKPAGRRKIARMPYWKRVEKRKGAFWRTIAKAEVALQRELGMEFERHEQAMRKILIKMRAERDR
jgi:hypothetical protein